MSTTRRGKIPGAPREEPWKPCEWEQPDAAAVQAVAYGRATEDQQRRAIKFIVENLCGTFDLSFRPSSDRDTAFAEGKRFVGLQIVKFTNLNLARLRGKVAEQGDAPKPKENPDG